MSPWHYLWRLYRPRMARWALAWIFLALTWVTGAALLALSGWFIAASALAGLGLLVGLNIFTPSTAIRGLALLKPVTRYVERIVGHDAVLRLLADLRVRSFAAVASVPSSRLQESPGAMRHADLVTRLTQDIDTLDAVPLRVLGPLVAASVTLAAAIVAMAHWGTRSMAVTLALGGVAVFAAAAAVAVLGQRRGHALISARAVVRVRLHDHLDGLAELRAYGRAASSQARLQSDIATQLARETAQDGLALWGEHGVQALIGVMLFSILALGWGAIEGPILALVALMTLGLGEALAGLPGAWWRTGEAEAAADRLMALEAQAPPETSERGFAMNKSDVSECPSTPPGAFVIRALRCQRQPGQDHAWSVTVPRGVPLVIHGASGSGKSSLLDTLAGELRPIAGAVRFDGADWFAVPDAARYFRMAYLGQQDHLLDLSVRAFLQLGLHEVDDAALHRALEDVALDAVFRRTGDGLDYQLGPRGSRVSGGQARRLQLAALRLRDPDLVLLDEPFRGLDAAVMAHLMPSLTSWLSTRCCIVVTHAPEALPASWPRQRWPASGSAPRSA